jgi:hypothetical protein
VGHRPHDARPRVRGRAPLNELLILGGSAGGCTLHLVYIFLVGVWPQHMWLPAGHSSAFVLDLLKYYYP